MVGRKESDSQRTPVEKKSEREVVVTRTFKAPARLAFEARSKPELFEKWWVPRSVGMTLRSCDMDVPDGGSSSRLGNIQRDSAFRFNSGVIAIFALPHDIQTSRSQFIHKEK